MIWQKWLRAALAVVLVALVAGVGWYVSRDRPVSEAAVEPTRTDPTAQTEIAGDEFTRTEDGKVLFRMKYERGYSYADGRVRLVKINGTFTRNAGAPMDVTADEADLVLKSGAGLDLAKFDEMHMRGHVVFKAGDELHMATEEAHYNDLTGIMETDKAATVTRGKMSGSGTGVTFDRERSVIWLLADAKVKMQLDGQGTLDVTSGRAGLADLEKYMRFEENVRMNRGGRLIETDSALANMTPDGKGITSLELRGQSRITGGSAGDGGVPNMAGDDITITYAPETGLLERAVLDRAARLDLPEGGGRSLAADSIDLGFAGDGTTLTALDANGAVELKIPAAGDEPATEVRAPRLDARGTAAKGLERATFTGGVEFREQAPARTGRDARDAIDRLGRSESLVLALDGGFSDIKDADFKGNVRFRDGDVNAEAPDAKYAVDTDRITLRGGTGGTSVARVVQEDGTIQARKIDLTMNPRTIAARDNVRSTLKPGARKDRKAPRPSILEDDQPVNVTAKSLDYDGKTERAVYTGDARLWQGDTVIQAETIVLDDKTGNLEARTNVRTQFLIREALEAGATPAPKPAPPKPTFGRAAELIYDEARRQTTFRTNASLQGPEGDIKGDRIELFLQEDGNTLDRAEAYDSVTARLDGGRVAIGSRLTYNAKTRRYDMRGAPLTVRQSRVDKGVTRCEETIGTTLTFDRSADTVSVVGANGAPSRTVPKPCTPGLP